MENIPRKVIKLKGSLQGWKAYKIAFVRANKLLTMSRKPNVDEKKVIEAYRAIIHYERRRWYYKYPTATDWEMYRLAYQDVLWYINRLRGYEDKMWKRMNSDERSFVRAFIFLMIYVREEKLGKFNKSKLYRFQLKLQAALAIGQQYFFY